MNVNADGGPIDDGAAARVRHVLVGARVPGNIGAAARAMKNFGFGRMVLVGEGCPPDDPEAHARAIHAVDVLDRASTAATLDEALEGTSISLAFTARRGRLRRPHWRLDELRQRFLEWSNAEVALVFGREDAGLTEPELHRCTHLVALPVGDEYPSVNLAQAVLLGSYECFMAQAAGPPPPATDPPAPHEDREAMVRQFGDALATIGFLNHDASRVIMRKLRRVFGRAELTPEEVNILRGIAHQMMWTADRAGMARHPAPHDD